MLNSKLQYPKEMLQQFKNSKFFISQSKQISESLN